MRFRFTTPAVPAVDLHAIAERVQGNPRALASAEQLHTDRIRAALDALHTTRHLPESHPDRVAAWDALPARS